MTDEQRSVDFNSDVSAEPDPTLLSFLTSVNMADVGEATRDLIATVLDYDAVIGAQVSYPELVRVEHSSMRKKENRGLISQSITQQILHVGVLASEEGLMLSHISPYGFLASDSGAYIDSAELLLDAVFVAEELMIDKDILPSEMEGLIPIYGLPNSALDHACRHVARPFTSVAFSDRAYSASGLLVPIGKPGSRITNSDDIISRSLSMVLEGSVVTIDGSTVFFTTEVLHFSPDTPRVGEVISRVHESLIGSGIAIASGDLE